MQRVYLTQRGILISVVDMTSLFSPKALRTMLNKLTIEYVPRKGMPIYAQSYSFTMVNSSRFYILPRSLWERMSTLEGVEATYALPEWTSDDSMDACLSPYKDLGFLMSNQKLLVEHMLATSFSPTSIAAGTGNMYLVLGTGQGKTFVAAGMIAALGVRTLYVTKNKVLAEQAEYDIGHSALKGLIVRTWSAEKKILEKNNKTGKIDPAHVIVIIINSAVKQELAFFKQFQLIILDEVHAYCADTFRGIFQKTQSRAVLAMTATPTQRSDGFDELAWRAYGAPFYAKDLPGAEIGAPKFKKQAKIIYYRGTKENTLSLKHENTDEIFVHYMYEQFIADKARVDLIVAELMKLYLWRDRVGRRHTIYMFADEIKGLEVIKAAFEEKVQVVLGEQWKPEESAMFISGVPLASIRDTAYVLWSTYGYGAVGVSISRASAMISITGRVSGTIQALGRITRRGSDVAIPRIAIDIVDANTCLRRQVDKRMLAYKEEGYMCTFETHDAGDSAPSSSDTWA